MEVEEGRYNKLPNVMSIYRILLCIPSSVITECQRVGNTVAIEIIGELPEDAHPHKYEKLVYYLGPESVYYRYDVVEHKSVERFYP